LERVKGLHPLAGPVFLQVRLVGLEHAFPFVRVVLNMLIQTLEGRKTVSQVNYIGPLFVG